MGCHPYEKVLDDGRDPTSVGKEIKTSICLTRGVILRSTGT